MATLQLSERIGRHGLKHMNEGLITFLPPSWLNDLT